MNRVWLILILLGASEPLHAQNLSGRVSASDIDGRIGIRVAKSGNVHYVYPGSPAAAAGLQASDTILKVDGQPRDVDEIRGAPGTNVLLEVKRGFSRLLFNITRIDSGAVSP